MSSDAFEKAYKDVSSKEFQETMDKLADFFKKQLCLILITYLRKM